MKKIISATLLFVSLSAIGQTAEEIVEGYIKGMGGIEAFSKVKTAKMTGIATVQGNDLPLTVQVINGRAVRTDVDVMGQFVTNSYIDGKGWKINPFAGFETATDVEGAELYELKLQSSLMNSLMDYKSLGNKIELAGTEDHSGVKTNKIKMTVQEDGRIVTYFINGDHDLVKSVTSREIMGQSTEIETYYSGVKIIEGLKFYMIRSQLAGGQPFQTISLASVELNVPIDEKVFAK
jgi:hypothetical protein